MMVQNCKKLLSELSEIEKYVEEIEKILQELNMEPDPHLLGTLIKIKFSKEK